MSYREALESAGAKVLAMQEFGSYQGDWWALCEYNGEKGWVTGCFGSCSGCDAFEAEFGYCWDEEDEGFNVETMKEFGLRYLDVLLTQEEALKQASENLDWDDEAIEMVEFIRRSWT